MGTAENRVKECLAAINQDNDSINAVLQVNPHALSEARTIDAKKTHGPLYGKVIGVKSNINVTGLTASCASQTLANYVSTYDATVIAKLKAADAVIIGMLNCDEFAAGTTGENSAFGPAVNPAVPGHIAGGSSSGSAAAVAAGFCDVALGSDTGGSIRVPASFCGVVGVKPSYGLVSRHGLIDLSMSLDQIGPLAKNVADAQAVLDVIRGQDDNDTMTYISEGLSEQLPKKLKVGVLRVKDVDSDVQGLIDTTIGRALDNYGWEQAEVELNHIDLSLQAYHVLCWTEFFSATRRFDGRKYGKKIEDSCGPEVLRRIIGGSEIAHSEFRGQYYDKALAVRKAIEDEFRELFAKVDCIMLPTVPVLPWKLGEKKSTEELYALDALVEPANLGRICSTSIPIGELDGKPVGMQVMCAHKDDAKMLAIATAIEAL